MIRGLRSRRGALPARELLGVLLVGLFVVLVVVWEDVDIRPSIALKVCMANMKRIETATRLALMEDPEQTDITIDYLVKKNYIDRVLRCPDCPGPADGEYKVEDKVGQPVDIVCVNHSRPEKSHGSWLRLKARYFPEDMEK